MCELLDIDKKRRTSFHPQSNGIEERFNRTIEDSLANLLVKIRGTGMNTFLYWCSLTDPLSTSTRQTPYVMFFGRITLLPKDFTCIPPCNVRKLSSHEYVLDLQGRLQKVCKFAHSETTKASDRQKIHMIIGFMSCLTKRVTWCGSAT